jgi:hypothetical protein
MATPEPEENGYQYPCSGSGPLGIGGCYVSAVLEDCDGTGEFSGGGDCGTPFMFTVGGECCGGNIPSGCDGKMCFQVIPIGETCCGGPISLQGVGINVTHFQSGVIAGGNATDQQSCNTDCEGKCWLQRAQCGLNTYVINESFCYFLSSGVACYFMPVSGDKGSCQQFYDVPYYPRNSFCDTEGEVELSASFATAEVTRVEGSCDVTFFVETEPTTSCGGTASSNADFGARYTHRFCTHSDNCRYLITVAGLETNGLVPELALSNATIGCTPAPSNPLPLLCSSAAWTQQCSGILGQGEHTLEFIYEHVTDHTPAAECTFTFSIVECYNDECEPCICTHFNPESITRFDWFDQCSGITQNENEIRVTGIMAGGVADYSCIWETDVLTTSTYDTGIINPIERHTKFSLICRDGCCDVPADFPLPPILSNPASIYLYEFYTLGTGTPNYDSDYYVWTNNNTCNPMDFSRTYTKCGEVEDPTDSCNYWFRVTNTGCMSNCATCEICIRSTLRESSWPVVGSPARIHQGSCTGVILSQGTTDRRGIFCATLSSGTVPWYFEIGSGVCNQSGCVGPLDCEDVFFDFQTFVATGCVIHSGAGQGAAIPCTLCEGRPYSKTLDYSDNFGTYNLQWNSMRTGWARTSCDLLLVNYCGMDAQTTGCYCLSSGYHLYDYLLKCENNDWKLTAKLPFRSCYCDSCIAYDSVCSGTNCTSRDYAPEYFERTCTGLFNNHSLCLPSKTQTFYRSSGDFSVSCSPLSISMDKDIRNEAPCSTLLYEYFFEATE